MRVTRWLRRAPMPYLEIYRLEVIDGSEPPRTCYNYWASRAVVAILAFGTAAVLFAAGL